MNPTKSLYFWRRVDGNLVRRHFRISQEGSRMIIESEEDAEPVAVSATPLPPGVSAGAQVQTRVDEAGVTHIESISPEYLKLFQLLRGQGECWFPGCEELLKQHAEELSVLGEDCPDCQKGAVTRKYIGLANGLIARAAHAKESTGN